MGRPRKSEPRNQQLNLSLTEAELDSIRRRAEAVGMRLVPFSRTVLLDTRRSPAAARVSVNAESTTDRLVYAQLARLGNNLNQLLRHLHATNDPVPADLEPLLADIRQILDRRGRP